MTFFPKEMARLKLSCLLIAVCTIIVTANDGTDSYCTSRDCRELGCKTNEIVSDCASPCPPTCGNRNSSCNLPCEKGCICSANYIREKDNGSCIRTRDCKQDCHADQIWEECSHEMCRLKCENLVNPQPCTGPCIPGCSCKAGYVWNEDFTRCVSINSCKIQCGPNQVLRDCSDTSCKRTCNDLTIPQQCTEPCIPGCSCQSGNVWNNDLTQCVPITSCQPQCSPNQVWKECSDSNCKQTCLTYMNPDPCILPCTPGCSCQDGYVWSNDLTQCVPITACPPPQCDSNQVWKECSDSNCKQTCLTHINPEPCILPCIPGCSCQEEYVWSNDFTRCVPITTCVPLIPLCDSNQVWKQCSDSNCKQTCLTYMNPEPCILPCTPGCSCQNGYVWSNDFTQCVPITACPPPPQCDSNQVWKQCSDSNCKQTCLTRINPEPCILPCIPGCSCQEEYVWSNDFTRCVPITTCLPLPPLCDSNQVWKQCSDSNCKQTCLTRINPEPCILPCIPGCSCQEKYVWSNDFTRCVPITTCLPLPPLCDSNQVWKQCSDSNCKQTCLTRINPEPCILPCMPGCSCQEEYVWSNDFTRCVPITTCVPLIPQCGSNQVWKECSDLNCKQTCHTYMNPDPCILPCVPGCSCLEGYVWSNDLTQCVQITACPPPPQCGSNQVWKQCSDSNCKQTCHTYVNPEPCILSCIPGCSCQSGYVWNEQQTDCIPSCNCPQECGPNQIWKECSDSTCKRTCKNIFESCQAMCVPGCSCSDGFLWDEQRIECIPFQSCQLECDLHQVWEQCSDNLCKKTCHNISKAIICPTVCISGCSCQSGFVWNDELTGCIPIGHCSTCGANQIWEVCSDSKITCANIDTKIDCPKNCIPGCSCKPEYVWNTQYTECIPKTDCPRLCGKNQVWEECSDNLCRRTCEYVNGPIDCPRICVKGCSCLHGFVWNHNQTECIPVDECSHECGPHQHWTECSDIHCRQTCANLGSNITCPKPCASGCSCNTGYVWNNEITECILACDCLKGLCQENEEWGNCANPECRSTCQNRYQRVCSNCYPGCVCQPGFLWDENLQRCIPENQCTTECGINGEWSLCPNRCDRTCQGPTIHACLPVCIPGCVCKQGYLMDYHQGHCVIPSECTPVCPPNKTWCRYLPRNTVTCQNVLLPLCYPQENLTEVLYPGCICREGLILNELTNNCIELQACVDLLNV